MNRGAGAFVAVAAAGVLAACSAGTTGHANADGSVYLQAVAPVNRDVVRLNHMIDVRDDNVADFAQLCLQISSDQHGFAAALRAYRWPPGARADAAALASAADHLGSYYENIAEWDETVSDFWAGVDALPSDQAQANAMRSDIGLPPAG